MKMRIFVPRDAAAISVGADEVATALEQAAAKRDLPDAIAIAGPLQHDLRAALDVLLRRAQQAGAVRADITTPDLITLLKGLLRTISDLPPGAADQSLTDRLLTVITDGLRPRP